MSQACLKQADSFPKLYISADDSSRVELGGIADPLERKLCGLATPTAAVASAVPVSFHSAVMNLSSNLYVRQTCDSLRRMIHFYRKSVLRQSQSSETESNVYVSRLRIKQLHHRQIVDAIAAHDTDLAFRLMQNHVRETAEDLLPRLPTGGKE